MTVIVQAALVIAAGLGMCAVLFVRWVTAVSEYMSKEKAINAELATACDDAWRRLIEIQRELTSIAPSSLIHEVSSVIGVLYQALSNAYSGDGGD